MNGYPLAYAAINGDLNIREKSSSGGIFYLLAEYVICSGGVVFGVKYDENWEPVHDYAECIDDVLGFLGSKYVQSCVRNTYREAEAFLKKGRLVLYSGTPCQILGLKSFIKKEYANLITVDLVCHGVPSRKVWRQYMELRSEQRKVVALSFRDKTEGWLDYSLKMDFADGSTYRNNQHEDLYMKGFLQNIYLRPSCYECRFKGIERNTDITLADLWGNKAILPEMFDNRGTSLVLIQSVKGADIWDNISKSIKNVELLTADYEKYNPNMRASVEKNYKRQKYFKDRSWGKLAKLTRPNRNPIRRAIRKLNRILKKIISKS